jgi:hypothetical protein
MFQESPELPVTTPTRTGEFHELAEAMRRGCVRRPVQCYGMFYNGPAAACALGAAQEGGYLMGRLVALSQNLWVKIARRNDNGHTREQIADWLCREGRCQHG